MAMMHGCLVLRLCVPLPSAFTGQEGRGCAPMPACTLANPHAIGRVGRPEGRGEALMSPPWQRHASPHPPALPNKTPPPPPEHMQTVREVLASGLVVRSTIDATVFSNVARCPPALRVLCLHARRCCWVPATGCGGGGGAPRWSAHPLFAQPPSLQVHQPRMRAQSGVGSHQVGFSL